MFKNKSFASDAPETELGLRSAGGETPPLRFQKCKITIKTCLSKFKNKNFSIPRYDCSSYPVRNQF